ncbi:MULTISPECIES: MBL fold metallo-hydrolase [unclassified Actinomyces]|uniref:MBL fold metallo-hydrolase n=1 Tax=unclassified Actinomyces TaxID=2609248 RepID=UPI002016EC70|nr:MULTISPECIES: MBL fold metallo-hydrolase [unclassified Actinomyces]MCL3776756.1 MBL fold metallo-hydrolase [Actinomyces sp. AC-20-1]MCL3789710.1 MBL fold metallo-hydrolase [Actinomyces sp. 187325]MCL3791895.1 MBL fold metallo-hydrolase [Actinomyces sp. 186855]MCL3794444.1 MBL fold metallo-hydrolase [Actinomyces sp. 217892]
MKLTVIGCTGSMSGPASAASSYLVQATGAGQDGEELIYSVVLDLGPGSMGQMLRYLDPADLDALLISHCHADHMVDMVGMHVYRRWHPAGALRPVLTVGPSELLHRLNGVDGTPETETYATEFDFRTAVPGESFQVGPMTITPYTALHPVEAYGYRIEGPSEEVGPEGRRRTVCLAFTGDTDLCEPICEMADGVDLLLAEAAFVEGRDTVRGMHLTGKRAGQLAAGTAGQVPRRPVGQLVLTHIQPWTEHRIPLRNAALAYEGPLEAATAGATWEI